MILGAIEWGLLIEVIWVSLIAGVAVTAVFSGVIYAGARSSEASRNDKGGLAVLYGALAAFGMCVFLAGLVFGVSVILTK